MFIYGMAPQDANSIKVVKTQRNFSVMELVFCLKWKENSILKLSELKIPTQCKGLSVVPANPMDLGYENQACIANANCLRRKLAL